MIPPDYVEKRDERFLIVWKDIPHWMVVDSEVLDVVRAADGHKTPKEIASTLWTENETKNIEVKQLLTLLTKAGVVFEGEIKKTPAPINPILENVTINVTRNCNLRCIHCFVPEVNQRNESLSITDVRKFLEEGKEYISPNLNFAVLGGDPLLAKEKTLQIGQLGKELRAEVVVSTNGLLVDSFFANKARDLGMVIQVSLEGSTPILNDSIRGHGSFDKAIRGIKLLVKHGTYTIISMVVRKDNFNDIESLYNLGRSLGVNEIRFIELRRMGRARTAGIEPVPSADLILALHKFFQKYPEARQYVKRDHYTIMKYICARSNKRPYCGTGLKTVLIDSDGEVYPCPNHAKPEFSCGNIREKSFKEIWLESPIIKKIRNAYHIDSINDECPECPVKYWCLGGCRGETYEHTGVLNARGVGCEGIRKAIIETFWILTEGEQIQETRTEYF